MFSVWLFFKGLCFITAISTEAKMTQFPAMSVLWFKPYHHYGGQSVIGEIGLILSGWNIARGIEVRLSGSVAIYLVNDARETNQSAVLARVMKHSRTHF